MSARKILGGTLTAVVLSATFGLTSSADAAFVMGWDATGDASDRFFYDPADFGDAEMGPDGTTTYDGGLQGSTWEVAWLVSQNPGATSLGPTGAFIDASITVTNNSATTETFSLLMTLSGIAPIGAPTDLAGSVGATVTNNQIDGSATLSDPTGFDATSVYTSLIDGSDVATLWDADYDLVATGPFATASDDDDYSGLVGPALTDSISILLEFDLSPGDSASVSGTFTVVPAPGAVALFGLFGIAGRRRRRA